jgi:hypothetical protein
VKFLENAAYFPAACSLIVPLLLTAFNEYALGGGEELPDLTEALFL